MANAEILKLKAYKANIPSPLSSFGTASYISMIEDPKNLKVEIILFREEEKMSKKISLSLQELEIIANIAVQKFNITIKNN